MSALNFRNPKAKPNPMRYTTRQDWVDEFYRHLGCISEAQRRWLVETQGVSGTALQRCGGYGVGPITTQKDGFLFSEDEEQELTALILGVWSFTFDLVPDDALDCYISHPSLLDLVAFDPKNPERFWLRSRSDQRSGPVFLGFDFYENACGTGLDIEPGPLRLYATPLRWLQGECQGACLLLDDGELWRDIFSGIPEIICDDDAHGLEVEKKLKKAQPKQALPGVFVADELPGIERPSIAA